MMAVRAHAVSAVRCEEAVAVPYGLRERVLPSWRHGRVSAPSASQPAHRSSKRR